MHMQNRNYSEPRNSLNPAAMPGLPLRKTRTLELDATFDYKDQELLKKFMTERGKVLPRRFTGGNARQQRQIKRAIRRARVMGLLP